MPSLIYRHPHAKNADVKIGALHSPFRVSLLLNHIIELLGQFPVSHLLQGCKIRLTDRALAVLAHHASILGTEIFGRIHQVSESGFGLGPLPGLEAAIGVDPQLFGPQVLQHFLNAIFDLLLTWHAR